MKMLAVVVMSAWVAGALHAQPAPSPSPGPAPTGLLVGSGNFFSPIVANLDRAVAFYRDGLGLDAGPAGDASANAPLRNMFGLPDARLNWVIARPPATAGGVEIIQITNAGGKPVDRRPQDSGAVTLVVLVRDIDAALARVKEQGAPIVTPGGAPLSVSFEGQTARAIVVKDPDGHFVELVQPARLPETAAPATANVIGVRVRLTVDDVAKSLQLFHDALGFALLSAGERRPNDTAAQALGVASGQYRIGVLQVPTSGLIVELIDFAGIERRAVRAKLADPGSTRMQLRVNDIDAAIAALKRVGGEVVSTGGVPLDLPAGQGTLKVAIVREPNNLFMVLIQAPPAPR